METPFIIINGEKIIPAAPKMKVWREFLKAADKDREDESMDDFLSDQVRLIIIAFGKPDVVNEKSIDEYVEISDIVPMVRRLFTWIQTVTFEKLVQAPNGEAEKD